MQVSPVTVLRKETFVRARWKNGLGYTDQIAIHPEGADLRRADFLWRVSSARIEAASEFSLFPNHDRVLVILDGDGVRLTHHFPEMEEEDSVDLPPGEVYEFPGDVPSRCELLGGPITDLSIFLRRGEVGAQVRVLEVDGDGFDLHAEGRWNFAFVIAGEIAASEGAEPVPAGSAARIEMGADSVRFHPTGESARVVVINLG